MVTMYVHWIASMRAQIKCCGLRRVFRIIHGHVSSRLLYVTTKILTSSQWLWCMRLMLQEHQAAAEGITLTQSLVIPRNGVNKAAYMERFPLSQGKIPGLEGPGVKLTETISIVYVSIEQAFTRFHLGFTYVHT